MPATVRQYELVYIVHPDASEEQVQAVIGKYSNLITTQGGEIERTDLWERRRLAYEIKGQREGVYIVTVFRGLPNVEAELRRVFRISEDTLRFIIVRPDEEIDTSVPSVQPRDFSSRPAQPHYAPAGAPPAVAAAAAAVEAVETGDEADSPGAAAGTATSVAAAASDEGVPEMAASDEDAEAEPETAPVPVGAAA